jgi:hypothetical protein
MNFVVSSIRSRKRRIKKNKLENNNKHTAKKRIVTPSGLLAFLRRD